MKHILGYFSIKINSSNKVPNHPVQNFLFLHNDMVLVRKILKWFLLNWQGSSVGYMIYYNFITSFIWKQNPKFWYCLPRCSFIELPPYCTTAGTFAFYFRPSRNYLNHYFLKLMDFLYRKLCQISLCCLHCNLW